jgi:HlyD family secretion protein
LQKEGSSSQSDLDDAELEANTARAHFNAATAEHKRLTAMKTSAVAQVAMIQSRIDRKGLEAANVLRQLDQAQARAQRAKHDLDLAAVASPIDGVVLERHQLGGGPIPAGTPLFLLGELNELEVEADVLTQDAFQLSPGAPVEYVVASGLPPLQGKVVRIEPAGFTKISSLGVEQQRVVVISSLDSRPENLGLGFRLIARYKKSSLDKALLVPRSSVLQDPNGTRYVFRDTEGVARRVDVELGLRSDFEVQIVKGLSAGDRVVQTPDATVTDGSSL